MTFNTLSGTNTLILGALYVSWKASDVWQIEAQREEAEVNQMRNDLELDEGFGSVDGDDSTQMTDTRNMMPTHY